MFRSGRWRALEANSHGAGATHRNCPLFSAPHLDYETPSENLREKVLDFVQSGGPDLTVDSTTFEVLFSL